MSTNKWNGIRLSQEDRRILRIYKAKYDHATYGYAIRDAITKAEGHNDHHNERASE